MRERTGCVESKVDIKSSMQPSVHFSNPTHQIGYNSPASQSYHTQSPPFSHNPTSAHGGRGIGCSCASLTTSSPTSRRRSHSGCFLLATFRTTGQGSCTLDDALQFEAARGRGAVDWFGRSDGGAVGCCGCGDGCYVGCRCRLAGRCGRSLRDWHGIRG